MRPTIRFVALFIMVISIVSACGSRAPIETVAATPSHAPPVSPTETTVPTETVAPEPSLTPTPTILDLEILEWSEWPYANLVDPSNKDTHVEALIRNPNSFPVKVGNGNDELRFVSVAGEVVYVNPNPVFYIWQGEWMLPGETAALSACVCFQTQGLERQNWETLELVAPLEIATDLAYTSDVDVTAEFVLLEEVTHGFTGPGVATTMTNTSDQVLESVAYRVLARDNNGRYVGVAASGNAVASFFERIGIQPGDTASGLSVSDINYVGNERLTYEVAAIGIPYQEEVVPAITLPVGTPSAEWEGFPIMPGAISGEAVGNSYQFTTQADIDSIVAFYQTELSNLGYEYELTVNESAGFTALYFVGNNITGAIVVTTVGGVNAVLITIGS